MNATTPGRLVDDLFDANRRPGDFKYYWLESSPLDGKPDGLHHRCPCGCDLIGGLAFSGPVQWSIEGDLDHPTCKPSVGFYGSNTREQGHHWHGFLTNGVWEGC